MKYNQPITIGGYKGARWTPLALGFKFFQFHAVFGKIGQNRMLVPPPPGLAPSPRGNPRSATDNVDIYLSYFVNFTKKDIQILFLPSLISVFKFY